MRSLAPPEPRAPRRRSGPPTAAGEALASARAAAAGLRLLAGAPRRRWRRHQARVALGAAVADHLAGRPAPAFLAAPLAAHRAAKLRLASTEVSPVGRGGRERPPGPPRGSEQPPGPPRGGERPSGTGEPHRAPGSPQGAAL